MALTRATPLLTTAAEVVDLTAVQDLAHLETGNEFSVADTLLAAHEWVFDTIEQRLGTAKVLLVSNEGRLERAVAARFIHVVIAAGHLFDGDADSRDYWGAQSVDEVNRFRPELTAGDEARNTASGIPAVGNFEEGWVYAPLDTGTSNDRYRRTLPRSW